MTSVQDNPPTIMIVEDDERLADLTCEYLQSNGLDVSVVSDGEEAIRRIRSEQPDLVVLDLMLPGMNGLEVCRALRERSERYTPVLMLTARGAVENKIEGFAAGADDYLAKPFSILELDARVKALVRRSAAPASKRLQIADLTLDLGTLEVKRGTHRIELAPIHIRILTLLMQRSPDVVSRSALESVVWGDDPPDSDALRVHIYTLRNAIDRPFDKALLHTVPKMGYRLAAIEDPA